MTDELDKASGLEMADRERALNAQLNRVKESPDTPDHCYLGASAWMALGFHTAASACAVTCIDCQTLRETA